MVRARRSKRSAKSDEAADAVVEAAPEELAGGDDAMEEGADSDAAAVIEHKSGDSEAEDKSYESEAVFEAAAESTAHGEEVKGYEGLNEVNEPNCDEMIEGDGDKMIESESVSASLEPLEAVPSDVIEGAEKAVASEGIEEAATSDVIEEASATSDTIKKEQEDAEVKVCEDLAEDQCLYCEVGDFSVASVSAYSLHLAAAHGVTRNARLLAQLTVDTHRQGRLAQDTVAVSPEPFLEAKLPVAEDIDSDDDLLAEDSEDQLLEAGQEEVNEEEAEKLLAVDATEVEQEKEAEADKVSNGEDKTVDTADEKTGGGQAEADEAVAEQMDQGEQEEQENRVETAADDIKQEAEPETEEPCKGPAPGPVDHLPPPSPDTLTIMASGADKFGPEEETEQQPGGEKTEEALSDLSLSDDDFAKADWVVLDEDNSTEDVKEGKKEAGKEVKKGKCGKCDTPHPLGQRCSFILKGGSRGRGRSEGRRSNLPKVRTLPPELYHHPSHSRASREREAPPRSSYRSRSPPQRVRRAPTPPSAYERNRDRLMAEERAGRRPALGEERGERKCKLCNTAGHLVKNCPDLFCYVCKQQGHFAKECPRPRNAPLPGAPPLPTAPPPPSRVEKAYPAPLPSYTTPQTAGYPQYYPPSAPLITAPAPPPPTMNALPPPSPAPSGYYTSAPPSLPAQGAITDLKPPHYTEALGSLHPLQTYMASKLQAGAGSGYPPSYIELLVANVGKMFAQANLGLGTLEATFFSHGETFLRSRISRELQVYAERFPGGVNMPLITETTVDYLKTKASMGRAFSY